MSLTLTQKNSRKFAEFCLCRLVDDEQCDLSKMTFDIKEGENEWSISRVSKDEWVASFNITKSKSKITLSDVKITSGGVESAAKDYRRFVILMRVLLSNQYKKKIVSAYPIDDNSKTSECKNLNSCMTLLKSSEFNEDLKAFYGEISSSDSLLLLGNSEDSGVDSVSGEGDVSGEGEVSGDASDEAKCSTLLEQATDDLDKTTIDQELLLTPEYVNKWAFIYFIYIACEDIGNKSKVSKLYSDLMHKIPPFFDGVSAAELKAILGIENTGPSVMDVDREENSIESIKPIDVVMDVVMDVDREEHSIESIKPIDVVDDTLVNLAKDKVVSRLYSIGKINDISSISDYKVPFTPTNKEEVNKLVNQMLSEFE